MAKRKQEMNRLPTQPSMTRSAWAGTGTVAAPLSRGEEEKSAMNRHLTFAGSGAANQAERDRYWIRLDSRPETQTLMRLSRRTFLKTTGTGAAIALSGSLGSRAEALLTPQTIEGEELHMDIKRAGSQPSRKGPTDWFTGTVRIDPLFELKAPSRALGISVTFEPGARTLWHTHPLGQNLIVTAGCGWAQRWGGPIEEIRPGDVVWIPPGEKHWHGAAPTTAMTHIAIYEHLDGTGADWMEKVSDEQYRK
jgi:quercetin dioxygenase-like cupin family protein